MRRWRAKCLSRPTREDQFSKVRVLRSHEFAIVNLYSSLRRCDGLDSNGSRSSLLLQENSVECFYNLSSLGDQLYVRDYTEMERLQRANISYFCETNYRSWCPENCSSIRVKQWPVWTRLQKYAANIFGNRSNMVIITTSHFSAQAVGTATQQLWVQSRTELRSTLAISTPSPLTKMLTPWQLADLFTSPTLQGHCTTLEKNFVRNL